MSSIITICVKIHRESAQPVICGFQQRPVILLMKWTHDYEQVTEAISTFFTVKHSKKGGSLREVEL